MSATPEQIKALANIRPGYRWKVQKCTAQAATCVAYIDARQVMDALDQTVGPENWQDNYSMIGSRLVCDLSIKIGDEWVSKRDAGSDSNYEAEKGGMSDAFKRAAVKWGIGRFLYSLDMVYIRETVEDGKDSRGKPKYAPAHQGKKIWDVDRHIKQHNLDKSLGKSTSELTTKKKQLWSLAKKMGWSQQELADYADLLLGKPLESITLHDARQMHKNMLEMPLAHGAVS